MKPALYSLVLSPMRRLTVIAIVSLTILGLAVWLSTQLPYLGLSLEVNETEQTVVVTQAEGPGASVPKGFLLATVSDPGGTTQPVTPDVLIEEPDTLPTRSLMLDVISRSGTIFDVLKGGSVTLGGTLTDGQPAKFDIEPGSVRPVADLPLAFWLQAGAGLLAVLVGAWVWSLNPSSAATIAVMASGFGLQLSATMAAIYSTRELALPEAQFYLLHRLNWTGTMTFGAGLVCLFTVFPRRLSHWRALIGATIIILGIWAHGLHPRAEDGAATYLSILAVFIVIFVLIALQFALSRNALVDRQALKMMGLGVLIATGSFILTRAIPMIFDLTAPVSQGASFVLIFIVYAAVAISVQRYRVFDLPMWSVNLLFYFVGACGLVALDAALVLGLSFGSTPALGLSLLAIGILYLPMRDWVRERTYLRSRKPSGSLLGAADYVVRSLDDEERLARWRDVLSDLYAPLSVEVKEDAGEAETPTILRNGEATRVPPPVPGLPVIELTLADSGRRLFNSADQRQLTEFEKIVQELLRGQEAYAIGVQQERARIARDLHDNLSIGLLGALHSPEIERKNALLQDALSDMRRVINNTASGAVGLDALLGEVRGNAVDLFDALGIALDWPLAESQTIEVSAEHAHMIRSFLREALTNVQRHSGADQVAVHVTTSDTELMASVTDNGTGLGPLFEADARGALSPSQNGLRNLVGRAAKLGGEVKFHGPPNGGTQISVRLPRNLRRAASESWGHEERPNC